MIKAGNVVVFIDNIMVETEIEKEYDNIVKKILKSMAKNNLFVKPEKYIQKIRKVSVRIMNSRLKFILFFISFFHFHFNLFSILRNQGQESQIVT